MLKPMLPVIVGALALLMGQSAPMAQLLDPRELQTPERQVPDSPLSRSDLPGPWRVTDLLGMEVRGVNEEEIGEVEDLLFDPSGLLLGIIIEGGGIFDLGDTHFRMEWHQVDFSPDREWLTVPMTEETVQGLSDPLRDWDDQLTLWTWRATNLLDSTVDLKDGPAYGAVTDLIVEDSRVRAVLVTPGAGQGGIEPRAFPYQEYDPGVGGGYDLPYNRAEAGELKDFIGDGPARQRRP